MFCQLSYRRAAKALMSLRLLTVSPESSFLAHIKYGSRTEITSTVAPLDTATGLGPLKKDFTHMR